MVIGPGIWENAGKSVVICILHYPNVFQNNISPKQHVVEKSNVVYSFVFTEDWGVYGLDRSTNAREEAKLKRFSEVGLLWELLFSRHSAKAGCLCIYLPENIFKDRAGNKQRYKIKFSLTKKKPKKNPKRTNKKNSLKFIDTSFQIYLSITLEKDFIRTFCKK